LSRMQQLEPPKLAYDPSQMSNNAGRGVSFFQIYVW
jgi:hypothetical protein